jgi:hypothetical protein
LRGNGVKKGIKQTRGTFGQLSEGHHTKLTRIVPLRKNFHHGRGNFHHGNAIANHDGGFTFNGAGNIY